MTTKLLNYFTGRSRSFFFATGTAAVLVIGIADYLLGHDVGLSIFYLIPIFIVAWFSGKAAGIYMVLISALIWFAADELAGNPYDRPYIPIWNAFVRLVFFLVAVVLLEAFKREKTSAREDFLTGLGNRRNFFELADKEVKRSRRYGHSFTVAYIDIDNFKSINDRYGHDTGDQLLRSVAGVIKGSIRGTDIDARLGGDEFALLLPESDAQSAVSFFDKLHGMLSGVAVPGVESVTFSVGVVTFLKPPPSTDAVIRAVDDVMYNAKESGKNAVRYRVVDTSHG